METIFDFGMDLLLPTFTTTILEAIDTLQKEQPIPYSDGIYFIEMRKQVVKSAGLLFEHLFPVVIDPLFSNLFRNDGIYCNQDATKFSVVKIDETYMKFSEGIAMKYPGYGIDKKFLVVNKDDITISLEEIKKIFLSKDMSLYEEVKEKYFKGQVRFLDEKMDEKIMYTSYPRSGNTFLRKYFESITGLATGSDQVMKFNLNVALQVAGFKGEGITDKRIWIQKSHYPYRFPYQAIYNSQVILCCVRNPIDVFVSFCLQICTLTHNKDINEDFTQYPEWKMHVESEVKIWKKWHNHWIQKAKKREVPIYFFRFEDLMRDPFSILSKIFQFSLGVQSIEGTIIEQRILESVQSGSGANTLYKPRQGGGGINRNLHRYSEEQLTFIKDQLEELLNFFGYTNEGGPDNLTPFFDYEGKGKEEYVQNFEGFKKLNDEVWDYWMSDYSKVKKVKHSVNKKGEGISMFKEKEIIKYLGLPTKSTIKEPKII